LITEEPDDRIGHVRICGGDGSVMAVSTRKAHSALVFPEGTVGALMDFEMISIREDKRLEVVLRYLRRFERLSDHTNKLMVVDKGGMLTGVLFFRICWCTIPTFMWRISWSGARSTFARMTTAKKWPTPSSATPWCPHP
jgi:hypothetical protein